MSNDDPTVPGGRLDPPRGNDAARECRNLALVIEALARKLDELEHPAEAVGARKLARELRRIALRLEPPPDTSGIVE